MIKKKNAQMRPETEKNTKKTSHTKQVKSEKRKGAFSHKLILSKPSWQPRVLLIDFDSEYHYQINLNAGRYNKYKTNLEESPQLIDHVDPTVDPCGSLQDFHLGQSHDLRSCS